MARAWMAPSLILSASSPRHRLARPPPDLRRDSGGHQRLPPLCHPLDVLDHVVGLASAAGALAEGRHEALRRRPRKFRIRTDEANGARSRRSRRGQVRLRVANSTTRENSRTRRARRFCRRAPNRGVRPRLGLKSTTRKSERALVDLSARTYEANEVLRPEKFRNRRRGKLKRASITMCRRGPPRRPRCTLTSTISKSTRKTRMRATRDSSRRRACRGASDLENSKSTTRKSNARSSI